MRMLSSQTEVMGQLELSYLREKNKVSLGCVSHCASMIGALVNEWRPSNFGLSSTKNLNWRWLKLLKNQPSYAQFGLQGLINCRLFAVWCSSAIQFCDPLFFDIITRQFRVTPRIEGHGEVSIALR